MRLGSMLKLLFIQSMATAVFTCPSSEFTWTPEAESGATMYQPFSRARSNSGVKTWMSAWLTPQRWNATSSGRGAGSPGAYAAKVSA